MPQLMSTIETTRFNLSPAAGFASACFEDCISDYSDNIDRMTTQERSFGIRVADTEEGRARASMLINKMYAWRGYQGTHRLDDNPNQITLSAVERGEVFGTVTLGIDSPMGILADEVFKDHLDKFRARGARLCEISKLAFDPTVRSKAALGSLFHILYIYATYVYQCTDAIIEINPRHRRYYETMLGFQNQSAVRTNPRVNAPAYLMWLDLGYMGEQIKRLGGSVDPQSEERSLYPYFFSQREERGIAERLMLIG